MNATKVFGNSATLKQAKASRVCKEASGLSKPANMATLSLFFSPAWLLWGLQAGSKFCSYTRLVSRAVLPCILFMQDLLASRLVLIVHIPTT